jgi:LDH2 family malate/lactate/ureidoglycolate dehydrogenase
VTLAVLPQPLQDYCAGLLVAWGLPPADADLVAGSLVAANLRGVDSHGVTRLPIYLERLRRGLVSTNPRIEIVRDSGGALLVDGDNGMGAVVTARALELGLERLSDHGTVSLAVRNTNHYGAGAFYAELATARDAAVFLYANAPATMSAWRGAERYLGTNPYTFGVPAGRHGPLILDMATSVVARGKIIQAAANGEPIPSGWALDAGGSPTTDARAALEGSVLPFGGPKGYGIALMVEIMAGILTGASVGPRIGDLYEDLDRPQHVGAFVQLVDVGALMPVDRFNERMERLVDEIKAGRPAPDADEVLIPGEIETRTTRERARDGIPLPQQVVDALDREAGTAGPRLSDLASSFDTRHARGRST